MAIVINPALARQEAQAMRNQIASQKQVLAEAKTKLHAVSAQWNSPSASVAIERMAAIEKNLAQHETTLLKHVAFLEQAADRYDATERNIEQSARA